MVQVGRLTAEQLKGAMLRESEQFEKTYLWLEEHMPPSFFDELEQEHLMLIGHNLMGFALSNFFTKIHLKNGAIVLCANTADGDLRILRDYQTHGIRSYASFTSDEPPPGSGLSESLCIGIIQFTELHSKEQKRIPLPLTVSEKNTLYKRLSERIEVSKEAFEELLSEVSPRLLKSLNEERMLIALHMYAKARHGDACQYELIKNPDWKKSTKKTPSLQIVLAWKNTPKHRFLYRLSKLVHRYGLDMARVSASYTNPYGRNNVLIMSLGLNGADGKAAWESANIEDFLQELTSLKAFGDEDRIESTFTDSKLLSGNLANFLRTALCFAHQCLVHGDLNLYSLENVEEALCRHVELTVSLCALFELKFHPQKNNLKDYQERHKELLRLISELDTGQEINDSRRKSVLKQVLHFIDYTLKTNFYAKERSAIAYRIDPQYLTLFPGEQKEKFPEIPYGIFFIQGMHAMGFHVRFKDLARGGLRTVLPRSAEQMHLDRNTVFAECYNLALTQQKKNKDIPEGGAKAIILLQPFDQVDFESQIYKQELKAMGESESESQKLLLAYKTQQRTEYLYTAQRAFIDALLTLVNCLESGQLKSDQIVDYYQKPEYIYLGPDENMHNEMIEWIAARSVHLGYKLGSAFISSKPQAGINHKYYGVTSLGVNEYMEEVLTYLEIDPRVDPFTIKMSGGPDGDVAGNQIANLYKYYPHTAKLVALIDGSGTIFDREGLDLKILNELFHAGKPISHYPAHALHEGGWLLDNLTKKEESSYVQLTLCYKKHKGEVIETWLSGNETNTLLRHNVHQAKADIFIPAGGRPRTLSEFNYTDFLDSEGKPTSRAIVEGANLYLSQQARYLLEKKGVIIIKDSSANKGGVICSSFEVLCNLVLSDEEFIQHKATLMPQILGIIKQKARSEAALMLSTYCETSASLIDISMWISDRINQYTYELLHYLESIELSSSLSDPLVRCLLSHAPAYLREHYARRLVERVPDIHKKAIISCYIASRLVYSRGLSWSPSIADILPLVVNDASVLDITAGETIP